MVETQRELNLFIYSKKCQYVKPLSKAKEMLRNRNNNNKGCYISRETKISIISCKLQTTKLSVETTTLRFCL